MDMLGINDLRALAGGSGGRCISIYMPTHRTGRGAEQDPVRFKNLLSRAEGLLLDGGLRSAEAGEMLRPGHMLLGDRDFWEHRSDGLAVFASSGIFRRYRLPMSFEELLVPGRRFHLKPLLPLFSGDGRFYLLALSQNGVRLFQGSRYSMAEAPLKDVPKSLADALKYDDPQKQLQFHTGTGGGMRQRPAMFHGHGVGVDDEKDAVLRFCRHVDRGLHELLKEERSFLVLAGVEYINAIYREANTYPCLVDRGVAGNPERTGAERLHKEAWAVVEPLFLRAREEAAARCRELLGTGHASADINVVVPAAYAGSVDVLFAASGEQEWGKYDPQTDTVSLEPEEGSEKEDLLDLAAVRTLLNRGTVYAIARDEMPADAPLAAVFRYASEKGG
jgi:hypothetical protein